MEVLRNGEAAVFAAQTTIDSLNDCFSRSLGLSLPFGDAAIAKFKFEKANGN